MILANVNDERSGGRTDIAEKEWLGVIESDNENSERTERTKEGIVSNVFNGNLLESGEVDVVVTLSSMVVLISRFYSR